jgi:hypothetical protein
MHSTLHDINVKAQSILARELDPLEYIQFFRQYEMGQGDYTRDREVLLGDPIIDEIIGEIQTKQANKPS